MCKSNGIAENNIENITKSDSSFAPIFVAHHLLPDITLNGHCLIKNKISIPKKVNINKSINPYISYTLAPWLRNLNIDFTLNNCLFGSVKLTKNADPDKHKYSGYDTWFDSHSEFLFTAGSMGRNIITSGVDMSSSVRVDNIVRFLNSSWQTNPGLDDTTLTAEDKYPVNFTQPKKRFLLSLRYNGINSFLSVVATKIYQLKATRSEVKDYILCLGNILKDFTINNMSKRGSGGVVSLISVDFNPIDINDF